MAIHQAGDPLFCFAAGLSKVVWEPARDQPITFPAAVPAGTPVIVAASVRTLTSLAVLV
jgi:hypothetical protein